MKRLVVFLLSLLLVTGVAVPTATSQDHPKQHKHARGCPKKCETCQKAIAKGLSFLVQKQKGDGSWEAGNGGTVVVTCIAAMALMANGSTPTKGPYAKNIQKAATFVLKTVAPGHKGGGKTASGKQFKGFGNWDLGYAAIFLGEYAMHVKTTDLSTKIPWLIEKIKENREANGGWGHAKDFAYKDLVVTSSACLAGLGSLKMAGFKIPQDVVDEGVKYFEESSAGGTVGYSPRQGQKGWGKAGRASGAAFAMYKLGVRSKYYGQVVKFIQRDIKSIPEDHASPTLHFLMGGIFARVLGAKAWAEYKGSFLDLWLGAQKDDGSFTCPVESDVQKSLGMDVDGMVGANWPTAVFCLVFQLPLDHTNLPNNKAKKGSTATKGGGLGLKKKQPKVEAKPYIGVRVTNSGFGVTVKKVVKDSPASKTSLKEGDLLVSFNNKTFDDVAGLKKLLEKAKAGKKVKITVLRGGEKEILMVTLGAFPKRDATASEEGEEL